MQEPFPPETVCSHLKHCEAEGLLGGGARARLAWYETWAQQTAQGHK